MTHNTITKIQETLKPDGQGGTTIETVELGSFDVKLSIGNNVEEATAYGCKVEEILKVIAGVPLMEDEASLYMIIGPAGKDGKDGYTPVKGVDYFDGEPGQKGDPGQNYTITPADYDAIATIVLDKLLKAEEEIGEEKERQLRKLMLKLYPQEEV